MRKKILGVLGCALVVSLASCGDNQTSSSQTSINVTPSSSAEELSYDEKGKEVNIYLAGDSTVKTYNDNQYIGGWGQYLDLFLDSNVKVYNCAQGGRSSRSFINEGRLFTIEGNNYSFDQNSGKSISETIKAGDYLFIQFGHNDDDTKMVSSASTNYSTLYDRMIPLGTPDANGIYPVTAGTKVATTSLPSAYTKYATASEQSKALTEIAKYGSMYYSYDCGGTYKWYLKQYIDFAREKNVIPVLVTPVSRVKYSGDTIVGGPGLHGDNFAYVEAVRQLAKEEDCLLIDLFSETKTILETATAAYGNYLMALKPNDLTGEWPSGYDAAYGNASAGYTGIEGTHYNKYGAYLTAAKVAENIINNKAVTHKDKTEYFKFANSVKTTPTKFINPSNLMAKSKINAVEALFKTVTVTDPNRTYPDPANVVALINTLATKTVTNDNYKEIGAECDTILSAYNKINADDRNKVTNYSKLTEYVAKVKEVELANRPVAIKTVKLDLEGLSAETISATKTIGDFKVVATSAKAVTLMASGASFVVNGQTVEVTKSLSMGGSATFGTSRYIEFTTTGKCTVTVVAKSTGSDARSLNLVESGSTTAVASFEAGASASVTSYEITKAGTFSLGSSNKGVYVYYILVEYFA